jgi:hypothetical protein
LARICPKISRKFRENFDPELAQLRPQNTPWTPPEHPLGPPRTPPGTPPEWATFWIPHPPRECSGIFMENRWEWLRFPHSNPTIFEWRTSLGPLDRGEKGWSPFSRKTCYTT